MRVFAPAGAAVAAVVICRAVVHRTVQHSRLDLLLHCCVHALPHRPASALLRRCARARALPGCVELAYHSLTKLKFTPAPPHCSPIRCLAAHAQSWGAAWLLLSLITCWAVGRAGTACRPGRRRSVAARSSAWPWQGCSSTSQPMPSWMSAPARCVCCFGSVLFLSVRHCDVLRLAGATVCFYNGAVALCFTCCAACRPQHCIISRTATNLTVVVLLIILLAALQTFSLTSFLNPWPLAGVC